MNRFEKHCWAEVDLDALHHNFSLVRQRVGGPVCAVIKADAYGHGDTAVARELQRDGAAAFAVSCLGEARRLRKAGITGPILILGYTDPAFADVLGRLSITQALFSTEYAEALSAAAVAAGVTVACHLKVDTGMGRIGFSPLHGFDAAVAEMERCAALPGLCVTGVFQHFAVADSLSPDDLAYTDAQYTLFTRVLERLRADGLDTGCVHCANSAAQLRHPEWRGSMTRAGIVLYGLDPSDEVHIDGLRQALTLKATLTHLKPLYPGESVSYGRAYVADIPRRVATVSVGYADGYPRLLSNGVGVMTLHGKPAPVLGRVCMDQTIIDVTDIPDAAMGDEVTVFGPGHAAGADTAESIARKTGTIPYEIVCGLARRVLRVYRQDGVLTGIRNDLEEC